ncbi:hypothetical protein ACFOLJ_30180 [Rugamonas sp. CCM 8940]|uniref:hypothetical protein n=1 Tax=Rugamonas sp. CCM 8940 TaxID=2765359 RepID=UPI0018F6A1D0|nr:hypothetical protein [Rugamonas sp. CCM 8940]MBJ7313094.1 hypothetical protein [Rugamonas sp. CCM 8940]
MVKVFLFILVSLLHFSSMGKDYKGRADLVRVIDGIKVLVHSNEELSSEFVSRIFELKLTPKCNVPPDGNVDGLYYCRYASNFKSKGAIKFVAFESLGKAAKPNLGGECFLASG